MNKNLHRVVFNKSRGIRMAVQETAASEGKASSASTQTGSTTADSLQVGPASRLYASLLDWRIKPISAAVKMAGAFALMLGSQAGFAQIIADPSAPNRQRPTVLESANGTPTVNIQTPSAGGVSRNTYQQFDIGQKGAILNNSRTNVQTQIGGWVQGNPWLANGGARVIVNEVNSAAQTRLMGPLEVAGQRADVIIANPSGLVVDGLSFINAAGVTLTTGRPLYGVNGSVDGFNVQKGLISIQGSGMDASKADYANILARAISLNAGLWAQDLRVVTGVNQVAADGSVQQGNPTAAGADPAQKPQFALDVAQLGGMYAGKIFIVGTEAGLGVKNAGTVSAGSRHLTLSVDGLLSNSGTLASNAGSADLSISAKGVDNGGTISSQRDAAINDGGVGVNNTGSIKAGQQLGVQAGQLSNQGSGSITAQRLDVTATGLSNAGNITQTGAQSLLISSATLSNTGSNAVLGAPPAPTSSGGSGTGAGSGAGTGGGSDSGAAPTSSQDGSAIQTTPVVPVILADGRIQVAQGIANTGKLLANGASDILVSQALTNSGTANVRQLHSDGVLNNSQGTLVAQSFSGSQSSFQNQSGSFFVQSDLQLNAQSLDNSAGSIGSAQSLSITTQQGVSNTTGTLAAGKDLTLQVQSLDSSSGRIVSNAGSISLDVSGALTNHQGQIGTASNTKEAQIGIHAQSLDNTLGEITHNGSGQLRINVADAVQSKQGKISSNGSAQIQATSLDNDAGKITALKQLDIATAQGVRNVAGSMQSGDGTATSASTAASEGSFKIHAGSGIDNRGGALFATGALDASAADIDNTKGSVAAMGDARIHASNSLTNTSGKLQANGAVDIQAGQRVDNQSGVIASSGGALQIQTQALDTQKGQISSAKDATIITQTLDNTQGLIEQASNGLLSMTASNSLTNTAGKIVSNGDLSVIAGKTNNQGGEITSLQNAQLQMAGLQSEQGLIQSGAALVIDSASDINNRKGQIQAQGPLTLDAKGQLANSEGKIQSSGAITVQSASLDNTAGSLSGTETVSVQTGALGNVQGTIAASKTLNLNSTSLNNQAGQIGAQTIAIDTQQGALNNDGGKIIASAGNLDVQSGSLHSDKGWLQAAQNLQVNTRGQTLTNTGTVLAMGNATVTAGDIDNTNGTMQAGGDTSANASLKVQSSGTITNAGGHLSASSDIDVTATELNNSQGQVGAGRQLNIQAQAGVTNSAGKLVGNTGVDFTSGSLTNNQQGVIGSSAGDVQLSTGQFNNQTGTVTAHGAATVTSQSLDNTQGQIGAGRLSINTQGQQLTNTDGQILASNGNLNVQSGWLDNQRGRIAALQNATLTANGINNDAGRITAASVQIQSKDAADHWSTVSNQGGTILADQRLQLDSSALNNSAGAIQTTASTSQLQINSHGGDITNQQSGSAGGIVSSGALQIDAQGASINNSQGGYIGAFGQAQLTGGQVINQGGSIASNNVLQISSTAGSGVGIDNTAGGSIQSNTDVKLYAQAAEIANTGGSITSNNDVLIQSSGKVNNDQGAIKAGHDLSVIDAGVATGAALSSASQTLSNQGGTLFAGNNLSIKNQSVSGAGSLQAQGGMQLAFAGNYTHQGDLSVNGDLTVESGGDFTNQGRIKGGRSVTVSGNNVDNQAGAEISSAGVTTVNANQTLTNRGLIDGSDTRINATTVDNVGTGRIYGDHVSIKADTLNNRAENGTSATIASRQDMDIGASVVNNTGGSTILSLGDMRFGATLDVNRVAAGQAQAINNTGSKIDSAGSINMNVAVVNNTNAGIEIAKQELVGSQAGENLVQLPGQQVESASNYREVWDGTFIPYFNDNGGWISNGKDIPGSSSDGRIFKVAHPDKFLTTLPVAIKSIQNCSSNGESDHCTVTYEYEAAGSTRFAQYGIDVPEKYNTIKPDPVKYGAYIDSESGALYWYAVDKAGYEAAVANYDESIASVKKLNDAILAEIKENNRFEDTERNYTIVSGVNNSVYKDRVISSTPGQITAGKDINVSGFLNNFDSTVIAGANITAGNLNNKSTVTGTETKTSNGTAVFYSWKYHGGFDDDQERRESAPQVFTSSQSTSFELPTVVFLQNQAGTGAGGSVGANGNTGHNASNTGGGASGVGQAVGNSGTIAQQGGQGSGSGNASSGGSVNSGGYNAGGSGSGNAPATVNQQPITTAAGEQVFIRTVASGPSLPSSSLYVVNAQNGNHPLVETDPAFASYKNWLSSDYMVNALSLDPALMQKRLGDGFYEQQLIQQQIGQLTGRRFLGDYTSNDAQYMALLQNGVTFAQAHALRPGVELSAAQVAQLTSDLVWLVSQNVTMPDGSIQSVLVPKVYVVAKPGDLSATGTLISADTISVKTDGDVHNSGTIAGRRAVLIAANDINNIGGHIVSDSVSLSARRDINVVGGTVSAALQLLAQAGNDINVVTTTRTTSGGNAQNGYSNTVVDRVAGLMLTGPLDGKAATGGVMSLNAGNDFHLQGAQIANAVDGGVTRINAGNNVNLFTVNTSTDNRITWDAKNHLFFGGSQEVGTQINTQGTTVINAGNDINARAAQVQTTQELRLNAGNDVNITAGQASQSLDDAYFVKSSGTFGSSTKTWVDKVHQTQAQGSSLGGDTVGISAGRDITVVGSNVVSDNATALQAGRDVNILAATETSSEQHLRKETSSGLLGGGGIGFTIGSKMQSTDQAATNSTAAASTVGSVNGNVNVVAGNAYRQVGSDVMAPKGDVNVVAQDIAITEAEQTHSSETHTKFKQSGLSVSLSAPVISTLQAASSLSEAASKTSDGRMQALAAGGAALTAYNSKDAVNALANGDVANAGFSASITVGSSKSQSDSSQSGTSSRGSNLQAGGNVNLIATGAGKDSNILVQGSDITAGKDVTLIADNQVNLLASQDTSRDRSTNSSSSAAVGVAVSVGQGGASFGITASASKGKGHANGDDVAYNNTHVNAGNTVTIQSGGDTNLKGAVVSGKQVIADVGVDLNLQSLQNTSTFDGKQQNIGGSVTVGAGFSGSASYSNSKAKGDFASVIEQTGIQAGDGGFQVNVKGNTDLKGAVIASNQTAIDNNRNSLTTATLTHSDIENRSDYKASGVNLSGGISIKGSSPGSPGAGTTGNGVNWSAQNYDKTGVNGAAAGVSSDKGSESSITRSGISAGNLTITDEAGQQQKTGQSAADVVASVKRDTVAGAGSGALTQNWEGQQLLQEQAANAQIMATFGQQASKAVGDYAQKMYESLKASNPEEAAKWAEGGAARVTLHTLIGGLGGGLAGALGSGAASAAAPAIDQLQQQFQSALQNSGLGEETAKAIASLAGGATAATIGAAASGGSVTGASTAFNADMNNRQLHYVADDDLRLKAAKLAKDPKYAGFTTDEIYYAIRVVYRNDQIGTKDLSSFDSEAAAKASGVPVSYDPTTNKWLEDSEVATVRLNGTQRTQLDSNLRSDLWNAGGNFRAELIEGSKPSVAAIADFVAGAAALGLAGRSQSSASSNTAKVPEAKDAPKGANGGVVTVIEPKIVQQMGARGWTAESIDATIANPAKTVVTQDTRFDPISGTRLKDPATGYVAKDGSYVVRNDRTGQVVQVSNKTDPTWKTPWDK